MQKTPTSRAKENIKCSQRVGQRGMNTGVKDRFPINHDCLTFLTFGKLVIDFSIMRITKLLVNTSVY